MAHCTACICSEDVRRILDPRRALVECVVDGCERSVLVRWKSDVLSADAVHDDCDVRLSGGVHGG